MKQPLDGNMTLEHHDDTQKGEEDVTKSISNSCQDEQHIRPAVRKKKKKKKNPRKVEKSRLLHSSARFNKEADVMLRNARLEQLEELQAIHSIYPPVTLLQHGALNIKDLPFDIILWMNNDLPTFESSDVLVETEINIFPDALENDDVEGLVHFMFTYSSPFNPLALASFEVTYSLLYPAEPPFIVIRSSVKFSENIINRIENEIEEIFTKSRGVWLFEATSIVSKYLDKADDIEFNTDEEAIGLSASSSMQERIGDSSVGASSKLTTRPSRQDLQKLRFFQAAVKARLRGNYSSDEEKLHFNPFMELCPGGSSDEDNVDESDKSDSKEPADLDDDYSHLWVQQIVQNPLWERGVTARQFRGGRTLASSQLPSQAFRPTNATQEIPLQKEELTSSTSDISASTVIPSIAENSSPYDITLTSSSMNTPSQDILVDTPQAYYAERYLTDFVELSLLRSTSNTTMTIVRHRLDMSRYVIKRFTLFPPDSNIIFDEMDEGITKEGAPCFSVNATKNGDHEELDGSYNLEEKSEMFGAEMKSRFFYPVIEEVTKLTQLHHSCIARYHQSWEETIRNELDEHPERVLKMSSMNETLQQSRKSQHHHSSSSTRLPSSPSQTITPQFPSNRAMHSTRPAINYNLTRLPMLSLNPSKGIGRSTKGNQEINNSKTSLCIQMEYCSGRSLEEEINRNVLQTEKHVIYTFFKQILEALVYIHCNGVFHKSLKPTNLFIELDEYGYSIKLSDFGLGMLMGLQNEEIDLLYRAPEVKDPSEYTEKADMYSLGVLFLEMWHPPFVDVNEKIKVLSSFINEENFPTYYTEVVPPEVPVLLKRLLSKEPSDRPTALELIQDPLIPHIVDKESLKYFFNRIRNPSSVESKRTMNILFSRVVDDASASAYIMNIPNYHWSNQILKDTIIVYLEEMFSRLGAVRINPPILEPDNLPTVDYEGSRNGMPNRIKNRQILIDKNNTILHLPFSLTHSFAVSALQYDIDAESVKRCAVLPVFTATKEPFNAGFGYPHEHLSCMFDMLIRSSQHRSSKIDERFTGETVSIVVSEAELFASVFEVLEPLSTHLGEINLRWTHTELLHALLVTRFNIPMDHALEVDRFLRRNQPTLDNISKLLKNILAPGTNIKKKASKLKALIEFKGPLRKLLPILLEAPRENSGSTKTVVSAEYKKCFDVFNEAITHVQSLNELLEAAECDKKCVFDLALDYDASIYGYSIAFNIYAADGGSEPVGSGGRYDKLIRERFYSDIDVELCPIAIGYEANVETIIETIKMKSKPVSILLGASASFSTESLAPSIVITTQYSQLRAKAFSLNNTLLSKSFNSVFRVNPIVDASKFQRVLRKFPSVKCHVQIQRHTHSFKNTVYIVEPISTNEVQKKKFDNESALVYYFQSIFGRKAKER